MPGVSMTVPPPGSERAIADELVCRPLPTPVTTPTARRASGHELVDQRRLAHAGLAEQHGDPALQAFSQLLDPGALAGDDRLDAERLVERQQLVGAGEVALGQAEQRHQPAVEGRHQAAVDQPWPGHRVGQRRDHDQQVGVRDDRPLDRVGVVRRTAQQRGARLDADHPGQGVGPAAEVADQRRPGRRRRRRGRPSSRARTAVTTDSSTTRTRYRPRSTVTTVPGAASSWPGRDLVRGRVLRGGRTRTSSSSSSRATGSALEHPGPGPNEVRHRLAGRRDVVDPMPSTPRPSTAQAIATRWSS